MCLDDVRFGSSTCHFVFTYVVDCLRCQGLQGVAPADPQTYTWYQKKMWFLLTWQPTPKQTWKQTESIPISPQLITITIDHPTEPKVLIIAVETNQRETCQSSNKHQLSSRISVCVSCFFILDLLGWWLEKKNKKTYSIPQNGGEQL